jgi:hypothetical protein
MLASGARKPGSYDTTTLRPHPKTGPPGLIRGHFFLDRRQRGIRRFGQKQDWLNDALTGGRGI